LGERKELPEWEFSSVGYVAKNRIGHKSGDLEIVARSHRNNNCEWVWIAICRRDRDGEECGAEVEITTHAIGEKLCCKDCSYKGRNNPGNSRYKWTPAMDKMITSIFYDRHEKRTSKLPSYSQYALQLGRTKSAVIQRKRALGLIVEKKGPLWSKEELRLLKRCSWMTANMAHRRLTNEGFKRSLAAVMLKLKRLRLSRRNREWLTARDLAEGLGIDSHKVAEWVKRGLITAKRREIEGTLIEYVFFPDRVRTFLLQHSSEIDLRKVDQVFFFDIIQKRAA
jgi:hypothetical protein